MNSIFAVYMKLTKYYAAAIVAFVIWGFFSLVLKPIAQYPSLDILFYRVFECAILMLLINAIFRRRVVKENIVRFNNLSAKTKREAALLNFGGGIFLTANWFFFIYVMNHISVKATSLAYLVCPILTTVLANFLLRERLDKWQWLSVGLSTAGCLLLSFNNPADLIYALVIALSYALYLVSQRRNNQFDKFLSLSFQIGISAVLLLPFFPAFGSAVPVSLSFYAFITLIAVLFTIIPLFLNLYALHGINSSTTGMLLNINPVIAFILAVFYFHEDINMYQALSYSVIFLSVILFNRQQIFGKN